MIAIPSAGMPNITRMVTSSGIEPPGTPAAPTAVSTAMIMTTIIWPRSSAIPKTWARKMTVIPSKRAVPFMHIVLPSGSTKPAIDGGIPRFCSATARAVGSVALLELVLNAVTSAARIRLKNRIGIDADDQTQDQRQVDQYVHQQRANHHQDVGA